MEIDEEALREFLPNAFGGRPDNSIEAQIEKARRPGFEKKAKSDNEDGDGSDEEDSSEDDSDDDESEFPISHEVVFKTHDKAITSITLDPSGARMVTGSSDCTVKFHDFASLAPNTIRAFKSLDPSATKTSANQEAHPIYTVQFNPNNANLILVVSAAVQAKIYDRDGEQEYQTVKGDMYLRDMNMTKGHVSEITCGAWSPVNPDQFVTAGTDSTLRIWDMNDAMKQRHIIVHKSKQAGAAGRSRITAVTWSMQSGSDTKTQIIAAALDGSLLIYPGEGPFHRPLAQIADAHNPDTWTSGIATSSDGRLIVTRGGDDTIKTWDTRKLDKPIRATPHLSTSQYSTSNIIFSPNDSAIVTGSPDGSLYILNPATLRSETTTPVTPGVALTQVHWHPKLKQIITGSVDGSVHVLFSPTHSTARTGALSILSRAPKRRHVDDDSALTTDTSSLGMSGDVIQTPSAPKLTGLTASGKSRDPRRPEVPTTTVFAKSTPSDDYIRKNIPLSDMREEDPREALLKYADKAKNDPMFTKAYLKSQPVTPYAEISDDEKDTSNKRRKVG